MWNNLYVVFGNINNVVFKIKNSNSTIRDRYLIHFRDLFDFFTHLFGVYRKTLYLCIGKLTIFNMKKHRIFIYAFIILLIIIIIGMALPKNIAFTNCCFVYWVLYFLFFFISAIYLTGGKRDPYLWESSKVASTLYLAFFWHLHHGITTLRKVILLCRYSERPLHLVLSSIRSYHSSTCKRIAPNYPLL